MNGNFSRASRTLQPVEVDLPQAGQQRARPEITFAATQTEVQEKEEEEEQQQQDEAETTTTTERSERVTTEEKEVQTEAVSEFAEDAVSRISVSEEISPKEEKETSTEKVSVADTSSQTEAEILADEDSENVPEVADVAPKSEESGRISAFTQTLPPEGVSVCEAEVQTDVDEREGRQTRSFLGSPADELVSYFLK